jgi:lipopolysaccharide biosynthesis regulator YciM
MAEYLFIFLGLMILMVGFYSLFSRYFKSPPRQESALYVSALQDLLDGKQETAYTNLRQVVLDDTNNVDAYIRLGQILRENNKPHQALQVHKDLTLRSGLPVKDRAAVLRQLALDYAALGNADTSEAALEELISLEPQNRWAHATLLEIQQKAGKWDEAYETAVTLLKMDANRSRKPLAVYKYNLGRQFYKKREYHKARVLFKDALGLDPQFVPAFLGIGDSYREEERFEDAVNFWNKLIEAVPDQAHLVIERLKKTLFDMGRFGDIVEICENILKHSPKNVEARLTLAEFYEKKGDVDAAEELLVQLVDDNPEDLKSILSLFGIYSARGDRRRTSELLRSLEHKWDKNHKPGTEAEVGTSLSGG